MGLELTTSAPLATFTLDGVEHEVRKPAVRRTLGLGKHLATIKAASVQAGPRPIWTQSTLQSIRSTTPLW